MAYSLVGILAIFIYLIINLDVLINIGAKKKFRGEMFYLLFLLGAIAFHITDGFWGILYDAKDVKGVFIDTTFYFVAMAASILFWGLFVFRYLGKKSIRAKMILYTEFIIFAFQLVAIVVNFFYPILFSVSSDCVYKAGPARYVTLGVQVLMYLLISFYSMVISIKSKDSSRGRLITIGVFGIFMTVAIMLQVFLPLMPMYSLGYLFGICLLHTFVIREEMIQQEIELNEAKIKVSTDPLTGVYSKHAYIDEEVKIETEIDNKTLTDLAVVVFDLNDLKFTNDSFGHEAGDNYLIDSSKLIKSYSKDIPLYRVGGDEFALFLRGEAFAKREEYFSEFNKQIDENVMNKDRIIIASGMAVYDKEIDTSIMQVFTRADCDMYQRKQQIKDKQKLL